MSTTTTAPSNVGGLPRNITITIAVCCCIGAACIIAIVLRICIPKFRNRKKKPQPDNRSLFHSTQSLANGENNFYYSGPLSLQQKHSNPQEGDDDRIISTVSGSVGDKLKSDQSYQNVSQEFRQSSAWVSGTQHLQQQPSDILTVDRDIRNNSESSQGVSNFEDNMRSEYSRPGSSHLHRERLSYHYGNENYQHFTPPGSRVTHNVQRDIIREDVAGIVAADGNYREEMPIYRPSTQSNSIYSVPSHPPRKVESPRDVAGRAVLNEIERERRPVPYVRSPGSEVPTSYFTEQQPDSPSWVTHALMLTNTAFTSTRDNSASVTQTTNFRNQSSVGRSESEMEARHRQLPVKEYALSRPRVNDARLEITPRNGLDVRELSQYNHYVQRPGPGTRSIYSLAKDAVRTPAMREFVQNGRQRREIQSREIHGNRGDYRGEYSDRSSRGDYRGEYSDRSSRADYQGEYNDRSSRADYQGEYNDRRFDEYPNMRRTSSNALEPVSDELAPTYLPPEYYEQRRIGSEADQLNQNLTSYLSGGLALKPLDMSDNYRTNWDKQFDPSHQTNGALSHHTHPSENRQLPLERELENIAAAQKIFERERQNFEAQKKNKGGKKGKGK